jgi:hypothetical protein
MINTSSLKTRWLVTGLFLITLLTRLPFASQYLYHWDSVNLAFGLLHFDVQAGAPQYPGYIVYALLGQLVNIFFDNPQTTMVLISIVSSGLAAVASYYLGRELFNHATGLIASAFLISSPLVWFYGEVALPHTLDLFAISLALLLLYRIMQGERRWLWLTAVFLALLGGVRQQDLLFLGPVILFAVWQAGIKRMILFGVIGAAVSLAWFIPLIQNAGGLQAYMLGSSAYSESFFSTTSVLHGAGMTGLRRNIVSKLIPYTLYAGGLALLPILYWGTRLPRRWQAWLKNRKTWFIILSIVPALAFYALIHMGQQGLVFVFMPLLFVLSAEGLRRLLPHLTAQKVAVAGVMFTGAAIFVLAPVYPLGSDVPRLLTYSTIREHDRTIAQRIDTVRSRFTPNDTILLADNWRHIEYYLSDYPLARVNIGSRWEVDEGELTDADFDFVSVDWFDSGVNDQWQVVILDAELQALFDKSPESLPGDQPIAYLTMKPDEALVLDGGVFYVQQAVSQQVNTSHTHTMS